MKAFEGAIINLREKLKSVLERVENIVGKDFFLKVIKSQCDDYTEII